MNCTNRRPVYLSLSFVLLAGCASVQPITAPPDASTPVRARVDSRLPTLGEKFGARTDLPNSYFGISGARGSLLLGLLGPLGVLANNAYVQSQNEKSGTTVSRFTTLNLATILREVDGGPGDAPMPRSAEYTMVPAGRIHMLEGDSFIVSCAINVYYPRGADRPWQMIYSSNPDVTFAIGNPVDEIVATSTLRDCLRNARALFTEHVSGTLGSLVTKELRLPDLTFTMPVYAEKLPGRVIGNNGHFVQEFRRSTIVRIQ